MIFNYSEVKQFIKFSSELNSNHIKNAKKYCLKAWVISSIDCTSAHLKHCLSYSHEALPKRPAYLKKIVNSIRKRGLKYKNIP